MNERKPKDIPHEVDNLVITCSDHRYQETIARRLKEEHDVDINQSDRISYPGASMAVADGTLVPSIQMLYELHNFKTVWVIDHTDCGGFGGLERFGGDEQKEKEAHFESFRRAKAAIAEVLPQMVVTTFVVDLEGNAVNK